MDFSIGKAKAVITKVVPRNSSEESELVVAVGVDIKDVPLEALAGAFRCNPEDIALLFQDPASDENESSRYPNLKALVATEGWKRKHAVKIGGQKKIRVMSVTGIHATPRGKGLSDMSLTVSIESPPEGYVEWLANSLNNSVWFELEQVERELPGIDGEGQPAETQDTLDLQGGKRRGRPPKAVKELE